MNKQQLAQKIWASANQMRSKIEASEYKDFILGFIFYKYLSDKEIEFLKDNDYDDELLKTVTETTPKPSNGCRKTSAILSPTKISSPPGSAWARILMFPMCVTRCRRSAG